MNFYLINRFSTDIANSAASSEQETDNKSQSRLDFEFLERNTQIPAKHNICSI